VLGLLAVGILVLGYGIYKILTAPPPGQPVVIVAPPPPPLPPPQAPAAPQQGAAVPAPAPTPGAANVAAPEVKPSAEDKPQDKGDKGKGEKGKSDKGHRRGSETASSKGSGDSKKGSETATAPTASGSESSSSKTSSKRGGKSLDDLLGEVGSKKGGGEEKPAAPAAAKLITLTQSDIVNAMKGVQPKVQACANQFKVPGTAMATIGVVSGGKVSTASVTGKFAGTPTGSCVEVAAKSAKFPPCQSMTFPWPFTLSPR
jgi:type IV secretory pathway VirB10-like protein